MIRDRIFLEEKILYKTVYNSIRKVGTAKIMCINYIKNIFRETIRISDFYSEDSDPHLDYYI